MTCAICRYYDVCVWHDIESEYCEEIRQTRINEEQ